MKLDLTPSLFFLIAKRFGPSSEKLSADQLGLFNEAEQEAEAHPAAAEIITVPTHTRKKPGRKALPEHLPRVELVHDLPEAKKTVSLRLR